MTAATRHGEATRRRVARRWAVLGAAALLAIAVWPTTCDAAASVAVAVRADAPVPTQVPSASVDAARSIADLVAPVPEAATVTVSHVASLAPVRAKGPAGLALLLLAFAVLGALLAPRSTGRTWAGGLQPIPTGHEGRWPVVGRAPPAPSRGRAR